MVGQMLVIKWIRAPRALLILVLLALTACGGPRAIETRPDDPANLPERYGLVAFKVISNTDRLAPALQNWTGAFAVDLDDMEKRYFLAAGGTGLNSSRVFVGAMPPGEYGIFLLQSFLRHADGSTWLNAPVPRGLGNFRVEEGRLTSLGSMVYQPLGQVGEGRDQTNLYVIARFDDEEPLEDFVAEAFPQAWAGIQTDLILGWEPDEHELERQDMADRLRRFARGIEPHRLPNGQAILTAPMGQIRLREGQGSWRRIDTGQNRHIGAVVAHGDGYLAGGERGLVMQAPSLEGPWEHLPGPSTQENVVWLHSDPVGGVVALAQKGWDVTFYAVSPDFSSWRKVAEFDSRPPLLWPRSGLVHGVSKSDGRVVIFGERERLVFDPVSGAVERFESRNLYHVTQQEDGTIVALPGRWWTGVANPEFSRDYGATWTTIRPVRDLESWQGASPPVVLPGDEFAVLSNQAYQDPQTRRRRHESELRLRVGVDNQILHWGEQLPEGCARLVPLISGPNGIFVSCNDGRLLLSTDGGRTWTVDLDTTMDEDDAPELLRQRQTT